MFSKFDTKFRIIKNNNVNIYCSLKIRTDQNWDAVNEIMDMNTNEKASNYWMYEVEASDHNPYPKILNYFVDLIEAKFSILGGIGVNKNDISIWLLTESNGEEQNNLEFNAELLSKISLYVTSFCISNWVA